METLSRREEQVLLAVWELKDGAYLMAIKDYLTRLTQKKWSVGIVHKPLLKLEKKGFIESFMGDSTAKRGGRRKKMYEVTILGVQELTKLKGEHDVLWKNFMRVEIMKDA